MQTSGKMLAILQSREFEFNKKRSTVCRTAFSFEIKRRFLLPKPSRRIDSPVGHVGMENCAKAFSFSSGLYLCRYVCLCPPFSLSHFSFTLCTSFSAPFHLVVLPYFFFLLLHLLLALASLFSVCLLRHSRRVSNSLSCPFMIETPRMTNIGDTLGKSRSEDSKFSSNFVCFIWIRPYFAMRRCNAFLFHSFVFDLISTRENFKIIYILRRVWKYCNIVNDSKIRTNMKKIFACMF